MKEFGTFDTLTDEEDTLYNRLMKVKHEIESLELEQNEAQQDIKMWRNKKLDEKFKVKFWLIVSLVIGVGALPWYLLALAAIPPNAPSMFAKVFNIIATFMALMQSFVFLPGFIITFIIFLVWLVLYHLRNSKKHKIMKLAENMGVVNRNVLIEEQKEIIRNTATRCEQLKEEQHRLKMRLDSIKRERMNEEQKLPAHCVEMHF